MKNMKKLLRKAMVFTLTAAMLVGTPLTASAAGLGDLYQIDQVEDGWGNVKPGTEDNTRTGTVTATQTNSGILAANAQLEGIVLDETNLELEIPEEGTLTASLDWGETTKDTALEEKLLKSLQWKSSSTDIVAIRVPNRSYNGGPRDVIQVVPKAAGTATITVSLDSNEYDIHYTAEATVTVVQYADKLEFKEEINADAYAGDSLVLNDYVVRYVDGKIAPTSDVLTFALKDNNKPAVATLKNGVLTFKSKTETKKVTVIAIGKKAKGTKEITINPGNNAKQLAFADKNCSFNINTEGMTKDVTVEVKQKEVSDKACTNKISWSSKKPAIVDVKTTAPQKLKDDKSTMTLIAKSAGKTQVVAKASNGKSATLTVTVSADLTKIEVTEAVPEVLYTGQTIDLYNLVDQYFENKGDKNFTDAGLKWTFKGTPKEQQPMKKVASITAKGVLTIKPDLTGGVKKLDIVVANAKKVGNKKPGDIKAELSIDLKQVNVTEITVRKGKTAIATAIVDPANGKVTVNKPVNTDTIAVDGTRIYELEAKGTIDDGAEQYLDGSVLGWTASGNGKIVKTSKNAYNNGVIKAVKKGNATVTISSATKKGTKYVAVKTTFKTKVTAPTKTLTLNVKNKGIAATGKKQIISVTPVLEKGTTTNKTKDIVWKATLKRGATTTPIADTNIKNGKITLDQNTYEPGDQLTVTATVKNGGPRTSITLTVVKESKNVEFQQEGSKVSALKNITADQTVAVKVNLKAGGNGDPGKDNVSGVTYTVNKAGIVRIVNNADGTIKIEPLTNGSVKITATTLDGKKGTLNVSVRQ